jgi:hypothetical protein
VQAGVVDGDRGVVGQRDEPPHVALGEHRRPPPPDLQHADELAAQPQRHREAERVSSLTANDMKSWLIVSSSR